MVTMICGGCGHQGELARFCRTEIGGDLPKNVYQFPACGLAIEKRIGLAKVLASGYVMSGPVELVRVQASL